MNFSEITDYLEYGAKARKSLDVDKLISIGNRLAVCFRNDGKLIVMGNGGSAADSQHIAAEFVGRFEMERNPLPALALNTNTSSVTAISNDYSYEKVFERQIKAFAGPSDFVLGISTSGNSRNVINALKTAKEIGCYCVSLTGEKVGNVDEYSDEVIKVNSTRTSIVQEVHIAIGHILSKIVEDELFQHSE